MASPVDQTQELAPFDPLEIFVKPWVGIAEMFWGEVLYASQTAEPAEDFAAARLAEVIAARGNLRTASSRKR